MKPDGELRLVGQLLDLPLIDKDGRSCGIVDDVELVGAVGEEMRIEALLVGPGAYKKRLPSWLYWLVKRIAGDHIARVPMNQIDSISGAVQLKCKAEELSLHRVEDRVRSWIPHKGAI